MGVKKNGPALVTRGGNVDMEASQTPKRSHNSEYGSSENGNFLDTFEVPTGGVFGPAERRINFAGFLATARVGDTLQAIFGPVDVSRRGLISNRDLLVVHRLNSEADITLVKGFFDQVLIIMPGRAFQELETK